MWKPDEAYHHGLEFFGDIVDSVDSASWDLPTPCDGWTVLDVLGHVGVTAQFGTELLEGRHPDWLPDPSPRAAVGDPPATWWNAVSRAVSDALDGADLAETVDSPRGKRTIGEGMTFPAVDLFVHGWDIAAATGKRVVIPDQAIEFARHVMEPLPETQIRSPQIFAPPVHPGEGADASDAFIAWTGRDPSGR